MSIYQHFRDDERPFIDNFTEWKAQVLERFIPKLTDFLDPRQQEIVKALTPLNDEVSVQLWGGYKGAERRRALLLPPYVEEGGLEAFKLKLFTLQYPKKFVAIDHRNLLGSLMGLGVIREKFGDLLITEDDTQLIVAEEIADFVRMNLTQVGKASVTCELISWESICLPDVQWDEHQGSVTSLRLDVVVAEMYRLSRSKATDLIKAERVKVNWKTIDKPSYELTPGDDLSVRGFGRSRVIAIEGETRRGNHWLRFGILK